MYAVHTKICMANATDQVEYSGGKMQVEVRLILATPMPVS